MKALGFIVGATIAGKVFDAIFTAITTEGKARKALIKELTKYS